MPEPSRSAPTPRARFDSVRLLRLAERQFGVLSREQLAACGASNGLISRMLARRQLHRIHPTVYALGHRALSIRGQLAAALLYAGRGSALSHGTAGWWWEVLEEAPICIHVCAPGAVASLPTVHVHHPRRVVRTWHRGLPVTGLAQTLLDVAPSQSLPATRYMLAEAAYRHHIKPSEIEPFLGRGRPGSANLRKALERHEPRLARTRSELERRFLLLCERAGLPLPAVNHRVAGLTVDAVWPDIGFAVELDGHRGHDGPYALERDRRRELILRRAGLRLARYTWEQVTREAASVEADIRAAIAEPSRSTPAPRARFGTVR